ncbi:MAG: LamG domain-containing protein [Actinomycetota bacterium]|nr:LamG domain-containing protein [Actinomycetota bacterium]
MTQPQPQITTEVSWSTDPDDAPVWVNIDNPGAGIFRQESISTFRGRGYEQDQVQPGPMRLNLDDSSGDFTPDNTGGAYYPNVDLDKRIRSRVTPPAPYDGTTYGLHDGFINDLPTEVSDGGFYTATTPLTALDAFETLGVIPLLSAYDHEVLISGPAAYYPCSDTAPMSGQGTPIGNLAPTSLPNAPLTYTGLKGGFAKLGANQLLAADTGTCLELDPQTGTLLGAPVTTGGYSVNLGKAGVVLPPSGGWTFETVIDPSATYVAGGTLGVMEQWGTDGDYQVRITIGSNVIIALVGFAGGTFVMQVVLFTTAFMDGQPHHIGLTLSADQKTATLTVDGLTSAPPQYATPGTNNNPATSGTAVAWGTTAGCLVGSSSRTGGTGNTWIQGRVGKIAIYNRPLTPTEITTHVQAENGFTGEATGARIGRILTYAGFSATRRTLDAGQSKTGPLLSVGQDALPLLQRVAQTEQGLIFINGAGTFVFLDRARTRNTISRVTLGTDTLPIDGTGLRFTKDKQRIKNVITASRPNGPTIRVTNATSIAKHHHRGAPITYEVGTDQELTDAATWELALYATAANRVSVIVLDPLTSPALWPWVLGLELGDRITLTNLPSYAPAAAMDFIVQSIGHDARQGPAGSWKTSLQLSPPIFPTLRATAAPSALSKLDAGLKIPY